MVIPEQGIPATFRQFNLPFGQHFLERRQIEINRTPFVTVFPCQGNVLELEHHRELIAGRIAVQLGNFRRRAPGFTHGQQIFITKGGTVHFLQKRMQPWAITRDALVDLLADQVNHVQAEATDPLLDPPVHHLMDFLLDLRVFPVQIRLLLREQVEVIFTGHLIKLPGTAAKDRTLIIRCRSILFRLAPDVIVTVWVVFRLAGFSEPRVLIGGMVNHQIHNDTNIALFGLCKQLLHIFHRAEFRGDILVV